MIAPSCEDGGKQKVTRTRTRCQAPSEHSLATLCRHGIFQDSVSCANVLTEIWHVRSFLALPNMHVRQGRICSYCRHTTCLFPRRLSVFGSSAVSFADERSRSGEPIRLSSRGIRLKSKGCKSMLQ